MGLFSIDISPYSIVLARENKEICFSVGDIFDILYKEKYFDLVLTAGVLIHIDPKDLIKALSEIFRVSKKYYLMLEYNEDYKKFKQIPYRNNVGLWKGNFKKLILDDYHSRIKLIFYI